MNAIVDKVRSLWIPLQDVNLLLPNVAVAEVIAFRVEEVLEAGPEWLLGGLRWREQHIPVVSFEAYCGRSAPALAEQTRIVVLNTLRGDAELPFYALATTGIPRLFLADEEALGDTLDAEEYAGEHCLSAVRIGNESAVIPDLNQLHRQVEAAWQPFAAD